MKYVLIGALGNINRSLVSRLVAAGHNVTVISSNPERSAAVAAAGARAAIGKIEDIGFLTASFSGADAVFTMVPPHYAAPDWKKYIHQMGRNQAEAISAAGVKKVVNLSSIGAHLSSGGGPVTGMHFVEQELNKLSGADVKHLRPGFFYTNFLTAIGMIKHGGFYGNNYGSETPLLLVAPADIAEVAAEELLGLSFTGKSFRYIVSDEKTSKEAASILGGAIGKPDLPYVEFSDEDALKGMQQAGFSEDLARNYVEMGRAMRSGEMSADYRRHQVTLSKTKLADFAGDFAAAYAGA
jgi:uncharacterized protein YbjT (DUF2867 family)